MDFESETFVAHTLRGTGHDAGEDGTGRGVPLVPVYAIQDARTGDKAQNGKGWRDDGTAYTLDIGSEPAIAYQCHGSNVGEMGTLRKGSGSVTGGVPFVAAPEPMFVHVNKGRPAGRGSRHTDMVSVKDHVETLTTDGHSQSAVCVPAIAFTMKDHGADAGDISPTLRSGGHAKSHANGGVYPGVTTPTMGVRRLTPREMERLQGFPDDYTAIPWRGKSASECPDGPRAKALGNSMAVPVMAWIGARIAIVEKA